MSLFQPVSQDEAVSSLKAFSVLLILKCISKIMFYRELSKVMFYREVITPICLQTPTLFFLKVHGFFSLIFIYLFMIERQRGRDTGRGRSRLHSGSPMWDSILGLQDHTLGQRQVLNR